MNVAGTFNPIDFGGKQNVNLRLKAVQVVKYVPMEDRNPFEIVECFTIEDDPKPFKQETTPVPIEEEEVVEEPKKVVKKSAPPATSNDDDLSAIIDDWD